MKTIINIILNWYRHSHEAVCQFLSSTFTSDHGYFYFGAGPARTTSTELVTGRARPLASMIVERINSTTTVAHTLVIDQLKLIATKFYKVASVNNNLALVVLPARYSQVLLPWKDDAVIKKTTFTPGFEINLSNITDINLTWFLSRLWLKRFDEGSCFHDRYHNTRSFCHGTP